MPDEKNRVRFSVIVPFYNIAQYVDQCMKSLIGQSFKDFEIIAVDDGSQDQTGALLDAYAAEDRRVRVVHKINGGLTSARKAGALVATGEYVLVVDGDDWIALDYLEKLNSILERTPVDIVICGYFKVSPNRMKAFPPRPINRKYGLFERAEIEERYLTSLFSVPQNVWGKAYRRDLYLSIQLPMDDAIRMGEDLCISYPSLARAERIYLLNEPLYFYRVNPESITNSHQKYVTWQECLSRLRYLGSALPLDKYNLRSQLAGCACYSLFNVILNHFCSEAYGVTTADSRKILSSAEAETWIADAVRNAHGRNRMAAIMLRFRLFALMKLISVVKRIYKG